MNQGTPSFASFTTIGVTPVALMASQAASNSASVRGGLASKSSPAAFTTALLYRKKQIWFWLAG